MVWRETRPTAENNYMEIFVQNYETIKSVLRQSESSNCKVSNLQKGENFLHHPQPWGVSHAPPLPVYTQRAITNGSLFEQEYVNTLISSGGTIHRG